METIVIATGNPHKVQELRAIFGTSDLSFVGLKDLPQDDFDEPEEHGATIEENARIKALSYAEQTGHLCLADDSGLEVDRLRGAPGVISSHYCTDGRETGMSRDERDAANIERLLKELDGVEDVDRMARFVCVMALAAPPHNSTPPTILATVRGTFEGQIGIPPRVPAGDQGFGYDPLFLVAPRYERTSAQLSADEKNRISHRAHAARLMLAELKRVLSL